MWSPRLDEGSMVSSHGGKGRLLRRWPTQGLKKQMEGVKGRQRIQVQGLDGKTRSTVWMSTRELSIAGMREWRRGQKSHWKKGKEQTGLEPQQSLWKSQWRSWNRPRLLCPTQYSDPEPTCTACAVWTAVEYGDFRHTQRCLSLWLIVVKKKKKNMQRHAHTGTSLQRWHCGPSTPKTALQGRLLSDQLHLCRGAGH